jgi:hypothetical protein
MMGVRLCQVERKTKDRTTTCEGDLYEEEKGDAIAANKGVETELG